MISYRGSTAPNAQQNSPLVANRTQTLTNPGAQEGDLLLAVFAGTDSEQGIVGWITPAGWFPLTDKVGNEASSGVSAEGLRIFYTIASDTEPETYTFTPSDGFDLLEGTRGSVVAYQGVDPLEPIVAWYGKDGHAVGDDFEVTIPSLPLPVSAGLAVLFSTVVAADGSGTSSYAIAQPAGATSRYNVDSTYDLSIPTGPTAAQAGSACADIAVSGGATAAYTWSFVYGGGPAPLSAPGACVVVVLRAANDGTLPWVLHGDPDRTAASINAYTITQERLYLGPGSAHLYAIYGMSIGASKRMNITRFSSASGAAEVTATIEGAYDIARGGSGQAFDVDYTDANLYFVTEYEDSSPDNSSGRVYRYDTATLTQQATSAWLPDDDSCCTLKVGMPGTWSAGYVFGASSYAGNTGHGLYVFNKTTLELIREVPYGSFFDVEAQSGAFVDMTCDCEGNPWLAGYDGDRTVVFFKVAADNTVTAYNATAAFPDGGGKSIGWNPRTSCLVTDFGKGVALWDTTSHAVTASYTIGGYTVANLQLIKSLLSSQSFGMTNTGVWISFNVADRASGSTGDGGYRVFFSLLQKLDEDTLALEATYTSPTGRGVHQLESLLLDVTVTPHKLWAWGRHPDQKFGNIWASIPFSDWLTTLPQDPADYWGVASGVPTQAQLIHARGYEFRSLLSAAVPTVAGTGGRLCSDFLAPPPPPPIEMTFRKTICLPRTITLKTFHSAKLSMFIEGENPVPILNSTIDDLVMGNDDLLIRDVDAIPDGLTMTKAWFTIKENLTQDDEEAPIQKVITPSLGADGQITDDGTDDGVGRISFRIQASDITRQNFSSRRLYYYDVKILLSDGKVYTREIGRLRLVTGVTDAIA